MLDTEEERGIYEAVLFILTIIFMVWLVFVAVHRLLGDFYVSHNGPINLQMHTDSGGSRGKSGHAPSSLALPPNKEINLRYWETY